MEIFRNVLSNNKSNVNLEKAMATHSSTLAWRIPGMGEPGGLPSMVSHRVRHDRSDLAAATLTTKDQKEKLRKQSHHCNKNNEIPRNKPT